jgi:hypothetical protein
MRRARTIARWLIAVTGSVGVAGGLAMAVANPAQAAVPDHWGFAYVNKPAGPAGITDPAHQAGSWPPGFFVKSAPASAKRVLVTFPRIASKNGVVHVTAVNDGPVWCEALGWGISGPNEVVGVRCYKALGGGTAVAVFSPFTVTYTTSTKGTFPATSAYGYVRWQPGTGISAHFNSTGAPDTVTPGAVGVWTVRLHGLGSPVQRGNVQVTAVNAAGPAKCEIQNWAWGSAGQAFLVRCFNAGATPLKTAWTLSYTNVRAITGTQPKHYAYTFNNKPLLAGPYAPLPAGVNFNSAGATNTITRAGAGLSLVTFPRQATLPNTVLVSPFGAGPGFCNLFTLWATPPGSPPGPVLVRDVGCYTTNGVQKATRSLVTYVAKK